MIGYPLTHDQKPAQGRLVSQFMIAGERPLLVAPQRPMSWAAGGRATWQESMWW